MSGFQRILCVVDPTQDKQPAMDRAAWLASQSGAAIDLLVCYYDQYLSGERFFDSTTLRKARAEMIDYHREKLESLAEPLRENNLTVTTTAVWAHPLHEGIARQSIALKADVVFKDTHYHSAVSRALFTNTDWNLIRICPVPLWLVGPGRIDRQANIIAAIDPFNEHDRPAALDKQILSIGQSIAANVDGTLHAFHSFDARIAAPFMTADAFIPNSIPSPEIELEMREQRQRRFTEVSEMYGVADEHAHLIEGVTHKALPDLAVDLDAALVVMGAVSRNKVKRIFIGATAERTLGHLPCDLLVVKPNAFSMPLDVDLSDAA